ncbi:hypothetical protein ABT354_06515 [Streptomyces sp. NPDC000594]|uniref:hypothetical protein n=1 Tax=Streptomyces sp. NPDC000594 TaxID=3154261 RepID=UPI00331D004D
MATAPLSGPGRSVHDLWLRHARDGGIFEEDGTFLVTAVTTGSHEVGWVSVALTATADVSRLRDDQNRIEFIARSNSGHAICGVTAEEYDYWVVSLSLT